MGPQNAILPRSPPSALQHHYSPVTFDKFILHSNLLKYVYYTPVKRDSGQETTSDNSFIMAMSQATNLVEKALGHTGTATTEQNVSNPARDRSKYADPSGETMKALTWQGKGSVKVGESSPNTKLGSPFPFRGLLTNPSRLPPQSRCPNPPSSSRGM